MMKAVYKGDAVTLIAEWSIRPSAVLSAQVSKRSNVSGIGIWFHATFMASSLNRKSPRILLRAAANAVQFSSRSKTDQRMLPLSPSSCSFSAYSRRPSHTVKASCIRAPSTMYFNRTVLALIRRVGSSRCATGAVEAISQERPKTRNGCATITCASVHHVPYPSKSER